MVFEVLWEIIASVEALFELGMCDIAGHDHGASQRQARSHRVLAKFCQDLGYRAVEVDAHDRTAELVILDVWEVLRRIRFELLEEHPIPGNLTEDLAMR
jgi:hypothetical protein